MLIRRSPWSSWSDRESENSVRANLPQAAASFGLRSTLNLVSLKARAGLEFNPGAGVFPLRFSADISGGGEVFNRQAE